MRQNIKDFVCIANETLPLVEPIYEFGSFQVPDQMEFADLRPLFPGKEYVGCDMREGPGVDKILNLHEIDVASGSVGTVLCFDTLEHVEYPRKAMKEIYRILKPDGVVVMSSVMNFPIHDHPYDYWRFTPEAFKSILNPFPHSLVGFQGKENFPHTVVGIGAKSKIVSLSSFTGKYDLWQKKDKWSIDQLVINLTPPVCLPIIARIYRAVRWCGRKGLLNGSNKK